jgi:hypothetical protein
MLLGCWVIDLFDNMYDLIDSTTFKLRRISPNLWKIFELTYQALKTHAINWIEGQRNLSSLASPIHH